jgi:hypothetical protein
LRFEVVGIAEVFYRNERHEFAKIATIGLKDKAYPHSKTTQIFLSPASLYYKPVVAILANSWRSLR